MDSQYKMFNIKLAVGVATEWEPDLFGFMSTVLSDVGRPDLTPPSPKSVAELLVCLVRICDLQGGYDDLEAGLYEISLYTRNNGTQAGEKYCLDVIKEIRKILKKRQA